MKRARLIAVALSVILIFQPFSAFSMNLDYLQSEKWRDDKNVVTEEIALSSLDKELKGTFSYYVDGLTVYVAFKVNENTDFFKSHPEKCSVKFVFESNLNKYFIDVDQNGILADARKEEKRIFDVKSNFSDADSGTFICAVEYLGDEDEFNIDVGFFTTSLYKVKKSIPVKRKVKEKETTSAKTTKPKTTTTKKAKTTAKKVTRFVPKYKTGTTGDRSKTKGNTKGNTTKGNGRTTTAKKNETQKTAETSQFADLSTEDSSQYKVRPSKFSILAAVLIALASLLFILLALNEKRKEREEKNEEDDD